MYWNCTAASLLAHHVAVCVSVTGWLRTVSRWWWTMSQQTSCWLDTVRMTSSGSVTLAVNWRCSPTATLGHWQLPATARLLVGWSLDSTSLSCWCCSINSDSEANSYSTVCCKRLKGDLWQWSDWLTDWLIELRFNPFHLTHFGVVCHKLRSDGTGVRKETSPLLSEVRLWWRQDKA